jgi:hypothetical protein
MKILITEEQYERLLTESILKGTLKDLKDNAKILFTFGTGMGAFMGPVSRLLEGSDFNFTNEEIGLLIATSVAILLNKTKKEDLLKKIKDKNLERALDGVKEFIEKSIDLIKDGIKEVLGVSYSLSEILGFAFLLKPVMDILKLVINDRSITIDNLYILTTGVALSALTFTIKNLIEKVKEKFNKKQ